jgi:CO/xanthine dehydrogenase FAD-binding subunit
MDLNVKTFDVVSQASQALADSDGLFFGGGTILMRVVNEGNPNLSLLVRTTDPRMRAITVANDKVILGGGTTMLDIINHQELEFLHAPARAVGGPAIHAMATVGGNLYARHPFGDFTTALLALSATVRFAGDDEGEEIPLEEMLKERESLPRRIVTSVAMSRPAHDIFRFTKISRVRPHRLPVMTLAACLPMSEGKITSARIAYGAMASIPVRVTAVEQALEGRALDPAGIRDAVAVATEGLSPPTDAIATEWYRREVAPVHLRHLLLGKSI